MHTYAAVFTPKDGAGTGFGNHVAPLEMGHGSDAGHATAAAEDYGDKLFPRWREFYDLEVLPVGHTASDGVDPFRGVPAEDQRKLATQFLVGALIALRPFAGMMRAAQKGRRWPAENGDGHPLATLAGQTLTLGDLRRALAWVEAAEAAGVGK